ncbi:MAG: phosphatase PAP2 family protein [Caldivirga sp.]
MGYLLTSVVLGSLYILVTILVGLRPSNIIDATVALWVSGIRRLRAIDYAAVLLTKYGRFYTWGLVDLVLLAMRLWIPFLELTVAMGIAYVVGGVTRLLVRRRRPYESGYGKPILTASGYSYPSGHAAIVFSGALVTLVSLGGLVSWILLTEAILVSMSRIYLNAHYLTDVLGGLLLGLTSGLLAIILMPIVANTLGVLLRINSALYLYSFSNVSGF